MKIKKICYICKNEFLSSNKDKKRKHCGNCIKNNIEWSKLTIIRNKELLKSHNFKYFCSSYSSTMGFYLTSNIILKWKESNLKKENIIKKLEEFKTLIDEEIENLKK